MHSSHALWKASIGVYRALAICTVLVRIARVTAGLDSAICAAMEKKEIEQNVTASRIYVSFPLI